MRFAQYMALASEHGMHATDISAAGFPIERA
jgi:hypothetical protein